MDDAQILFTLLVYTLCSYLRSTRLFYALPKYLKDELVRVEKRVDCEQSLFFWKICKREYLSSEVANTSLAPSPLARPREFVCCLGPECMSVKLLFLTLYSFTAFHI